MYKYIYIKSQQSSERYKISGKLFIDNNIFLNKWLRVVQNNLATIDFRIETLGTYEFEWEGKLSDQEQKESRLKIAYEICDAPLISSSCNSATPENITNEIKSILSLTPIDFTASNKSKILSIAKSLKTNKTPDESCCQRITDDIYNALKNKNGFSIIRLGDGEGRFIGFPEIFTLYEVNEDCIGYQYGEKVYDLIAKKYIKDGLYTSILLHKEFIKSSINSADIVCAPNCEWYDFDPTEDLFNGMIGAAISSLYVHTKCNQEFTPDTFIFRKMYSDGYLQEILLKSRFVSVISHTNINKKLEEKFRTKFTEHIKISGHQSFMNNDEPQFPNNFYSTVNQINVLGAGHVFLVAAGYLGKHYCKIIKARGGIALDIGNLFDSWSGTGRVDAVNFEPHIFRL